MRAMVRTVLDAPAERVRQEVRTTRRLRHVAGPILMFRPVDPPAFPERWPEGRLLMKLRAFDLLPLGSQRIVTSGPEDQTAGTYCIRDAGSGTLARVWHHRVTISARVDGRADYRDDVDVEAGILTPFVWGFAHVFYRYRQWRLLAKAMLTGEWSRHSDLNRGPAVYERRGT